jgi:hypothetical protein
VSVADFYGRWAALYDRVATAPGVGRWRRAAAERVARPGDTVVEMGCGTGANLPYLRERVGPTGRVVGVDLTGPPLRRAAAGPAGTATTMSPSSTGTRPTRRSRPPTPSSAPSSADCSTTPATSSIGGAIWSDPAAGSR